MGKELLGSAPSLYDIPFLQNVVLTRVVKEMRPTSNLRGVELLPEFDEGTRKVEWEVAYGGDTMADIVAHDAASPLGNRPGAERKSAELVDIRQKMFLDEDDILFLRQLGERESRRLAAEAHVTRDIATMRGRVERRIEKMRWDALISGRIDETVTVDGKSQRYFIDFGVPAAQRTSGTASGWGGAWTTPGTADPKLTFTKAVATTFDATGRRIKFAWMNTNTHNTLDQVSGLHTDFRSQESAPQDLVKAAHVTDIIKNVRIIDYDEGYHARDDVNGTGTFTRYLPDNRVLFTVGREDDGEVYGDVAVGPARLATGEIVQGLFAETWINPDPTREYVRVGKLAVPRIYHPDWVISFDAAN